MSTITEKHFLCSRAMKTFSRKWLTVSRDHRDRTALGAVTASNARFPLFLTTTNCLDFLLLVVGADRSETVPNHTYLRFELIVSSLCDCIDTETLLFCTSRYYSRPN